jgi:hypothetical protein
VGADLELEAEVDVEGPCGAVGAEPVAGVCAGVEEGVCETAGAVATGVVVGEGVGGAVLCTTGACASAEASLFAVAGPSP